MKLLSELLEKENNFSLVNKEDVTDEIVDIVVKKLGIDWKKVEFTKEEFKKGLKIETEHGPIDPKTDVTNGCPIITGKITLAHLNELSDYYVRLEKMENNAKK
jgi:hypothetical protein